MSNLTTKFCEYDSKANWDAIKQYVFLSNKTHEELHCKGKLRMKTYKNWKPEWCDWNQTAFIVFTFHQISFSIRNWDSER